MTNLNANRKKKIQLQLEKSYILIKTPVAYNYNTIIKLFILAKKQNINLKYLYLHNGFKNKHVLCRYCY